MFDIGVYIPFNKGNDLNLKNHKSNREKVLSLNQVYFLLKKNHQDLYKSIRYVHARPRKSFEPEPSLFSFEKKSPRSI